MHQRLHRNVSWILDNRVFVSRPSPPPRDNATFCFAFEILRLMRVTGEYHFDLFSPRQQNPSSQYHHRCTQLYKHRIYIDKWWSRLVLQFIKRRYGRLLYGKLNKRFNSENEMNHERQTTTHNAAILAMAAIFEYASRDIVTHNENDMNCLLK